MRRIPLVVFYLVFCIPLLMWVVLYLVTGTMFHSLETMLERMSHVEAAVRRWGKS